MEAINQSSSQSMQDLSHSDSNPHEEHAELLFQIQDEDICISLFADFEGMDENILRKLREILNGFKNRDWAKSIGAPPLSTLLLHGPPGCGKTKLAQTIGHGLGLPFYPVQSTPRVKGEILHGIFRNACHNAPSVIFIGDLHVMVSMRADPKFKKEKQTVENLIACINESINALRARNDNNCSVLLIAGTNELELLDPKLVMHPYFDQQIYIDLPNEDARRHILSKLTKDMMLDENIDFSEIARITSGYGWEDLEALVREAGKCCTKWFQSEVEKNVSNEVKKTGCSTSWPPEINLKHHASTADFLEAAISIQPSLGNDS